MKARMKARYYTALTPQAGAEDAELQAHKEWESGMFCDEKAGWEHSKMNPRNTPHGKGGANG